MPSLNVDSLNNALENENNASILNQTSSKIKNMKNNILQKLQLSGEILKEFHKKLKYYKYVDELNDINYGCYIRWISLKNPEKIYLTNGGIICDIKILENGIHIMVKNNMNRIIQIKLDENIIFQKLTEQEIIILQALDYLQK